MPEEDEEEGKDSTNRKREEEEMRGATEDEEEGKRKGTKGRERRGGVLVPESPLSEPASLRFSLTPKEMPVIRDCSR